MATNGSFNQGATEQYPATSGLTESNTGNGSGNGDLSKDEVGWYFVEQYYTTLSKTPEKLHVSLILSAAKNADEIIAVLLQALSICLWS